MINYDYVLKNDNGVNLHDVVFNDDQFRVNSHRPP